MASTIIRTGAKTSSQNHMPRILRSAQQGKLVIVVGTGVSIGLTSGVIPSWSQLIKNGFDYATKKGRITPAQLSSWGGQLASSDMDDLLSAAEYLGRKLGAPSDPIYARWLEDEFGSAEVKNEHLSTALRSIASLGIPICTLNYDPLLELVTGLPAIQVAETAKVAAWMRREFPAVLHLHGSWDSPKSCILGIRDYESTQANEVRDLFQRNLAIFNHLLFIGCGDTLADPNFSALIDWLKSKFSALTPQHIALVREADIPSRNADPAWAGFVEPLSYGKGHDDLAGFLVKNFPSIASKKKSSRSREPISVDANLVLENYRDFLLRDCGQMTIEGVSADMDTGQRKFDLERLFVPLQILACPPDFPPGDPEAAVKLKKWHKENREARPFGRVLSTRKSLALLALPGGGKTLLLKRLAVAYAEPSRLGASADDLPDLKLFPVLIRCREWRQHIKLPILTLLKNIGDITGQENLTGLSDALIPLLKKGQVLLLIDGLDEIHNDADRSTFVDHIESFLDVYKSTQIVVTSREAGFNLVAPSLARFCERWRLAPLAEDAISLLCDHWHRLMTGDTPAAIAEGHDVAQTLLKNGSLRRLAENPLLLTMLLVVKHGAGGLPPDRVTLYGRAVDVLLDTWNIKGHEPLNAREAVPQLAYVAFQLMCLGKQTATEKELLTLLEEARAKHPNIRRYAKDSPHEFLKRVELRSSLLLEAGHQMEDGRTVPFYQFRHLTFQEYLTAVAATEGHYKNFQQHDTVLTPLVPYLLAEEWKEVIPMVAVLARKRAEPLLIELISEGNDRRISSGENEDSGEFFGHDRKLPGPAGRLVQCLVEEAEASPETLASALELIAFFAHGCRSADDWEILCRGPYGQELYFQAYALLTSRRWPDGAWIMNSCAGFAAYLKPESYWFGEQGREEISALIQSGEKDKLVHGLLICMGLVWNSVFKDRKKDEEEESIENIISIAQLESYLLEKDHSIWGVAGWIWANVRRRKPVAKVSAPVLNRLLQNWFKNKKYREGGIAAYALGCQLGMERNDWSPTLTKIQSQKILEHLEQEESPNDSQNFERAAAFFVAFHSKNVCADKALAAKWVSVGSAIHIPVNDKRYASIRRALGIRLRKPQKA